MDVFEDRLELVGVGALPSRTIPLSAGDVSDTDKLAGTTKVPLYFKTLFPSATKFSPQSLQELKSAVNTCDQPSSEGDFSFSIRVPLAQTGPTEPEQKRPPLVLIHGTNKCM